MAEIKKLAVRKDDMVIINSGDDKGKKGKVLETIEIEEEQEPIRQLSAV